MSRTKQAARKRPHPGARSLAKRLTRSDSGVVQPKEPDKDFVYQSLSPISSKAKQKPKTTETSTLTPTSTPTPTSSPALQTETTGEESEIGTPPKKRSRASAPSKADSGGDEHLNEEMLDPAVKKLRGEVEDVQEKVIDRAVVRIVKVKPKPRPSCKFSPLAARDEAKKHNNESTDASDEEEIREGLQQDTETPMSAKNEQSRRAKLPPSHSSNGESKSDMATATVSSTKGNDGSAEVDIDHLQSIHDELLGLEEGLSSLKSRVAVLLQKARA